MNYNKTLSNCYQIVINKQVKSTLGAIDSRGTISPASRAAVADSSRGISRAIYALLSASFIFSGMNSSNAVDNSKDVEMYKLYTHIKLMNAKEYRCVELLWNAESKWNPKANNKKSTAYGIPQLLKLKENNPYIQIDLGLKYISKRYGSTCKAWAKHKAVGHY